MKRLFLFIIISSTILSCELSNKKTKNLVENEECLISFYFTPRNANHGWADLGVFKYNFSEHNVLVPFGERSYNPKTERSYVHEYCYVTKKMNPSFFINSLSSPLKEKKDVTRILINLCNRDTLEIDSEYLMSYDGNTYRLNDTVVEFLHDLMPLDIKENWLYNISVVEAPGRIHPYKEDDGN